MIEVGATKTQLGATEIARAAAAADAVAGSTGAKAVIFKAAAAAPPPVAIPSHQVLDVVEFFSQFQGMCAVATMHSVRLLYKTNRQRSHV